MAKLLRITFSPKYYHMAAQASKMTAIEGMNLDRDETRLEPNEASFVKGWTWDVNKNDSGEGYNAGIASPREGDKIHTLSFSMPTGDNYCIGTYEAKQTNELYVFVWNSEANHFIYRILGYDGTVQKVYQSKYLGFILNPEYYISESRCVLKVVEYYNKVSESMQRWSFLIFTNVSRQPCMLCVEASISTNSFDGATIPYFDPLVSGAAAVDQVLGKFINLAVATPLDCVTFEPQKRYASDKSKQNLLLYKGWQWRIKYIDVFNRESEHGVISERYFTVIGSNCLAASSSMPRCVRLKLNAGGSLVNKIQIEFRNCQGNSDLAIDGDWYLYDTLDKYDNSGAVNFWQRPIQNPYKARLDAMNAVNTGAPGTYSADQIAEAIAPLLKYNVGDNTFEYTFCADKQCQPIPVSETQRTNNLVPKTTESIFSLNQGIGLANNERQFEPLSKTEIDRVTVTAIAPSGDCDEFVLRKITVYAVLYRPGSGATAALNGSIQYVSLGDPDVPSELNLNSCGGADKLTFRTYWGWPNHASDAVNAGQVFPDGQNGFVAYLAGTSYAAIGEQVVIDASTFSECEIGIFNDDGTFNTTACDTFTGVIAQKFVFTVPPGEYVVRLSHHRAKLSEDYQATSTYTTGKATFATMATALASLPNTRTKEMVVDVTAGNYVNHTDAFYVMDTTFGQPDAGVFGYECYVVEDQVGSVPISLARLVTQTGLVPSANIEKWSSALTDHNGFYFVSGPNALEEIIQLERCDAPNPSYPFYMPDWIGWSQTWAATVCIHGSLGMPAAYRYLYADLDKFPDKDRRVISGKVLLCGDANIGIAGVPVVPYNLRHTLTDTNGEWRVVAHGRDNTTYRPNTDTMLVSQSACLYVTCADPCVFKFPHYTVNYIGCQVALRNTAVADLHLNIRGINKSGPQNGGRYQFGFVFHADGRHDYVQTGEHLIVDVPSMLTTHRFANSTFLFAIDAAFRAPAWAEYMTFVITRNLNWDDFFMWSADRVVFVDAAGYEHSSNPTKIRIYYESMIEYLKQNNLNDNSLWQFITDGSTTKTVVGDVIEFYRNGDGTWLPNSILSDIRYDKVGQYIEIDYVPDFKDLKDGALFKVIRPKTCTVNELFFELCPTIKVVDRIPQVLSGTLSYQDSYYLTRQFPVPLYSKDPDDPTKIIKSVNVRYSTYFYEHHSPSDFWGSHCSTKGRVFYKNPFERVQHLGMEIALSKPLLNKSNFNGLSYFEAEDIASFDEQAWGQITAVLTQINTVLVICRNNRFIVGYNDTLQRADQDGNIYAGSPEGKFGQPQKKIGQAFGLQRADVNTLREKDGVVVYLDRNKSCLVLDAYTQAGNISKTGGYHGWLSDKIQWQNAANTGRFAGKYFFVAGIDPLTKEYYLTSFSVPSLVGEGGSWSGLDAAYVNQNNSPVIANTNETLVVDLLTGKAKGFAAYTPEYYGSLDGFYADQNIFSFRRGQAWSLHSGDQARPRLNYFGVQTKKVLKLVTNIDPNKVKQFMWMEVYNDGHKLIATAIVTQKGQYSRLLALHWNKVDNFYTAAFLCAVNSVTDPNQSLASGANAIQDGDPLIGRWVEVTLESEPGKDGDYCELSGVNTYCIPIGAGDK